MTTDMVNHPPHYTVHPSGLECIEVTRRCPFSMGNAIKYIWRADHKNGVEDFKKARWYLKDVLKYGQASHPPYRVGQMLVKVAEADNNDDRKALFDLIASGSLRSAIAYIDDLVGPEQ